MVPSQTMWEITFFKGFKNEGFCGKKGQKKGGGRKGISHNIDDGTIFQIDFGQDEQIISSENGRVQIFSQMPM